LFDLQLQNLTSDSEPTLTDGKLCGVDAFDAKSVVKQFVESHLVRSCFAKDLLEPSKCFGVIRSTDVYRMLLDPDDVTSARF
jgi:hypothetical protein